MRKLEPGEKEFDQVWDAMKEQYSPSLEDVFEWCIGGIYNIINSTDLKNKLINNRTQIEHWLKAATFAMSRLPKIDENEQDELGIHSLFG